eukprot:197876-Chlamydomonas_euryale.AAC.2
MRRVASTPCPPQRAKAYATGPVRGVPPMRANATGPVRGESGGGGAYVRCLSTPPHKLCVAETCA